MRILRSVSEFEQQNKFLAVTLGNFDGVHLGHQQLLRLAVMEAKKRCGLSMAFTFEPHPLVVLSEQQPQLLQSRTEKSKAIAEFGLDYLLELPFTAELAAMQPKYFAEQFLGPHGLAADLLVVGFNFSFGAKGAGGPQTLQALGFEHGYRVEIVPPCQQNGGIVSSSWLRKLIAAGQIVQANQLLGREYALTGEVVHGRQLGRQFFGFPTANILATSDMLLPAFGVYAAYAECLDQTWPAVVNVGLRPTVAENIVSTIETHCLGADCDFYGQEMRVRFVQEIRSERKFASMELLREQIAADSETAAKILL